MRHIAMGLGLAFTLAGADPAAAGKKSTRYPMYRNPPKLLLAILPVQSRRLERPGREVFNQSLLKEARKLACCHIVPLPEGTLDSLGQVPPQTLPSLREHDGIDLLLQTKLEYAPDKNSLFAEIIDTRNGDIRASFHEQCQCPVGEVLLWMVPESIRRLGNSLGVRQPACKPEMVLVQAPVTPGSAEPDSLGQAWGSGTFCLDRYEYPNYAGGEPVSGVAWQAAADMCAKQGKRLCTEAEWELACSGEQGLAYAYGREYEKGRCNTESQTIQLSGGNSRCKTAQGAFDLSGNLYEWTASPWSAGSPDKVVKGGNWNSGPGNSRCHTRFAQPPGEASQSIGLRCCLSAER